MVAPFTVSACMNLNLGRILWFWWPSRGMYVHVCWLWMTTQWKRKIVLGLLAMGYGTDEVSVVDIAPTILYKRYCMVLPVVTNTSLDRRSVVMRRLRAKPGQMISTMMMWQVKGTESEFLIRRQPRIMTACAASFTSIAYYCTDTYKLCVYSAVEYDCAPSRL